MILIPILQSLIFIFYIRFIIKRYGILSSISDSWYKLPESDNWMFTMFIWGIGIPMLMFATTENILYFFSGAFISFVGAAREFKDRSADIIHYIGAAGGIAFALTALVLDGIWFPFILVLTFSIALRSFKISNLTWWIEVIAFIFIELGLIAKIICE